MSAAQEVIEIFKAACMLAIAAGIWVGFLALLKIAANLEGWQEDDFDGDEDE